MKLHPGVCITSFTCSLLSWLVCYQAVEGEIALPVKQQSSDVQHHSAASVLSKCKVRMGLVTAFPWEKRVYKVIGKKEFSAAQSPSNKTLNM